MSILLITHDLGVVAEMAHRVAVMYAGEIVEMAPREAFFRNPAHPYSRKLFESLPNRQARRQIAGGDPRHGAAARRRVPRLPLRRSLRSRLGSLPRGDSGVVEPIADGQGARCHLVRRRGEGRGARGEAKASRTKAEDEAELASELLIPRPSSLVPHPSRAHCSPSTTCKVHFPIRKGLFKRVVGHVKAVDGVSLVDPRRDRTLALVGESGCGKTTVGKGILRLLPLSGGSVRFDGEDLASLPASELRAAPQDFQIIFQDPYSSLNPRMRVMEIVEEGMTALGVGSDTQARAKRIDELLGQVGLSSGHEVPLSARVLRRAAPAHRHRARACGRAAS